MERSGTISDGELVTVETLAKRLGCRDTRYIRDHILRAGCPHVRLGNKTFISGTTLRLWLESQELPEGPEADDDG